MSHIPNIRRAVHSMKWAIVPEKLDAILEVLEIRASQGKRFTEEQLSERLAGVGAPRIHAAARTSKAKGGSVAILPLTGLIAPKSNMVNGESLPSGTSCEAFAAAFDAAMNDDSISAIVIDIDSPGGSVTGVPELAQRISSARGRKPITAVANSLAASAAYWIGSAADELVVSPSGEVGSIGVFCIHEDASNYFADMGVKHTIIKAGEFKAEGNPYEPLSEDGRAAMQSDVDEIYGWFVSAVAKHRGVGAATVQKNFGKGRCVMAKMAVASGMADRIGTLESVLAKYGVSNGSYASAKRADDTDLPIAASDDLNLTVSVDTEPLREALEEIKLAVTQAHSTASRALKGDPINTTTSAGVAAVVVPSLHASQPAPQGQENTVADMPSASPSGVANSDVLANERKRVQEIRALCRDHKVDDANFVDSLIDRGVSADAASREILNAKREAEASLPRITNVVDRAADRPFKNLGEQLQAVVRAGKTGINDPRLNRLAGSPSGMNESVGSEGGFLIEPDFLPELAQVVFEDDPILSRVKRIPSAKNIVKYNVLDETSRATGSRAGGVQVYWAAEADTATAKKPKLRQMVLEKKKIIGLAYLTDELQEDAPAAQSIISGAFSKELAFTMANAVFRGQGSGQPLGFLNSAATASVAIEAGQTIANTAQSIAINTSKMLARVPASLWNDVIFLYNQEVLPKLAVATIGSSGAVPVFMGAGGMSGKPYDTIWGRPAFASELCEAEGTAGDIIAIAPSQYAVLGGDSTKVMESIHVRFLYDENTLRFTTRMDGAPEWTSTITRFKGSAALSPFVTLAARS